MNTEPVDTSFSSKPYRVKEYKLVCLRESLIPERMALIDTPDKAADYWNSHIKTHPFFRAECECFVVLHLNTRRRITSHHFVSVGTLDTLLVHPRNVFRAAVVDNAAALICMHNHPSGEATPSEADIKVTRDLIRAGQLLKVQVTDHVVMGSGQWTSLRALGYFYT